MYEETRIPWLRAALWASMTDAVSGSASVVPGASLIVPDGCMDLIVIGAGSEPAFEAGDRFDLGPSFDLFSQVVIAGADSTARVFHGSGASAVGLRFDPGVLPQLLATSAAELAERVTPLDAVLSLGRVVGSLGPTAGRAGSAASARSLSNPRFDARTVAGGSSAGPAEQTVLGPAAPTRLSPAARMLLRIAETLTVRADLDGRPMAMADRLGVRGGTPAMTVAEVAAEFAYSPRQLRRLSAEWFGYGPKHLAKVLRWQAARSLIDGGRTRTEAAARAGYSDAAHLWRDERSLLGSSMLGSSQGV
ncbi:MULTISPECIES: helix-turn-helix domain-containing protein [unclassified Brevibacterium]|uniref:helix-turn-helix domain-containing protein n=2 Tax=Brevibacterium TaxID=1696 RepID=UPI001E57ADA0|nr:MULTISPECIES: helix-turn-helix domain-containing protein [unclassified Brevibacterium]MCD1287711.1 hypothetical protein [Brevibacterium sp. CCUG 69071]MDK8433314.1 helix-turn-helix domain-containing protein [Brevibacterium sp. H-BE7]